MHKLSLLHVNDTESVLEPWPRLAAIIKERRRAGHCDLLLHAGDVKLGPAAALPQVKILNHLQFDGVAVGNHDLDKKGPDALEQQAALLKMPLLCANVIGRPFRPFRLLRRQGLRVAVCGVTTRDLTTLLPQRFLDGLMMQDPAEALQALVPRLRQTADLVVVLSHCGYAADRAIAGAVPGIDLVVGGHSHHLLAEPVRVGDTWILQAGAFGEYIGWADVTLADGKVDVTGGLLPSAEASPDRRAAALIEAERVEEPNPLIGFAGVDLRADTHAQETRLANWTADAIRRHAGTDLALIRASTVNRSFPAGPLHRKEVAVLNYCGGDLLARVTLTGTELLDVLECGATRPVGNRVASLTVNGTPLDQARAYTVACTEIFARGAAGFTPLQGKAHEILPDTLTEVLTRQLAIEGTIMPELDGRLTIRWD